MKKLFQQWHQWHCWAVRWSGGGQDVRSVRLRGKGEKTVMWKKCATRPNICRHYETIVFDTTVEGFILGFAFLPLSTSVSSLLSLLCCCWSKRCWLPVLVWFDSRGPLPPFFFRGVWDIARRFLDGEDFTRDKRKVLCKGSHSETDIIIQTETVLTWDFLEDCVTHELLKSFCIEPWSMHRHRILKKRSGCQQTPVKLISQLSRGTLPHHEPEISKSAQASLPIWKYTELDLHNTPDTLTRFESLRLH